MVGASSCASVDPSEDFTRAASFVESRSGVDVAWDEGWTSGSADRWDPSVALGASDVARLALSNHAGLRTAIESIATARADFVQASLLPNPVLQATLALPFDGGPGEMAMGGLLVPLVALWQRPAAKSAAEARLRATVLSVSNTALSLVADAKLAHARLVFAERDLAVAQRSSELAEQTFELVARRMAEGEASLLERNRAELEHIDALNLLTNVRMRGERARRVLLEVCGLADAVSMPQIDDVPSEVPDWVTEVDEAEFVRLAEEQRLDLAAARALLEGAIDASRLAELQRIAALSVGPGYQRNFQGREAIGPSLSFALPLFDAGSARIAKAESLARTAAAEVERLRQAAIAEVRRAWVQFCGELERLARVRDVLLDGAIENHALARETFGAGVIDRETLIDAERRELRARLEFHRAELACVEWFVELERAVGGALAGGGALPSDVNHGVESGAATRR